jgi:hypothetical protein
MNGVACRVCKAKDSGHGDSGNGYSGVMSFTTFLAIVVAVNLISAVVCGLMANRAERDPFAWQLFGAILGPIGLIVLLGVLSRHNGE